MKIEKLNSDKIKVTLTSAELMMLDIDVNTLAPDSKELHTFLFNIMEAIREETGFNPYNGQVVVEASPMRGGITLIVSRVGEGGRKITRESFDAARSVKVRSKRRSGYIRVFRFDSFDDMCTALNAAGAATLERAELYRLKDTYYIITESEQRSDDGVNFLSEFAREEYSGSMHVNYIREHAEIVAKNDGLVSMAENLRQIL